MNLTFSDLAFGVLIGIFTILGFMHRAIRGKNTERLIMPLGATAFALVIAAWVVLRFNLLNYLRF
jgi:hypothetical protein